MSIERDIIDVKNTDPKQPGPESREQRKARLATVLERGYVADRLKVDLPDDKYGEWVPDDPAEVHRMEILGFEIDSQYGLKRSLHGDATPMTKIGDVVFMVTSKENKELLDEIKEEQFERRHGKPGDEVRKTQGEEKEFTSPAHQIGVPVIEESTTKVARKAEIEAVLGGPKSR